MAKVSCSHGVNDLGSGFVFCLLLLRQGMLCGLLVSHSAGRTCLFATMAFTFFFGFVRLRYHLIFLRQTRAFLYYLG